IEVRQAVGVVSDILNEVKTRLTDVKRAGNSDYENEVPFSVLSEAAADAIISIDDQSTILYVNPAAGRMFGYEPAEMVGKNLTCLMPEQLRQIHLASIKRYITKGERHIDWVAVELTGLKKSGPEFPIEVSFAEHIRNGGRFFTGFVRDITGRKGSEEALRESDHGCRQLSITRLPSFSSRTWNFATCWSTGNMNAGMRFDERIFAGKPILTF